MKIPRKFIFIFLLGGVIHCSFSQNSYKKPGLFQPAENFRRSIQAGIRYVIIPTGWGLETDIGYIIGKGKMALIANFGIHLESYRNANITRVPIQLGAKYQVASLKRIVFLYGGVAASNYIQSNSNLVTNNPPAKYLLGASVFGEIYVNMKYGLGLIFRGEEVFILNKKLTNESGKKEAIFFRNFSIGLRKTF